MALPTLGWRFDSAYPLQQKTQRIYHATNYSVFEFARKYKDKGMLAYSKLQEAEFAAEQYGYTSTKHQREVGVGYFDAIATALGSGGTAALRGSTEEEQF